MSPITLSRPSMFRSASTMFSVVGGEAGAAFLGRGIGGGFLRKRRQESSVGNDGGLVSENCLHLAADARGDGLLSGGSASANALRSDLKSVRSPERFDLLSDFGD